MDTHTLLKYLAKQQIQGSDVINAPANDPILLQAQQDGYVDRIADQWVGRGKIQPGETRVLRYGKLSGGGTDLITG